MKKYINADILKDMLNAKGDMATGTPKAVFYNAAKIVDTLPAEDVVQVIHCKNCRYYNKRWGCFKLEINVSGNDWCCFAESEISEVEYEE